MCAQYWNLIATVTCPYCGETFEDNLQTHFMGDYSFDQYYRLNEDVPLLKGIDVVLDGRIDAFAGSHTGCPVGRPNSRYPWFNVGARIEKGQVKEVWVLPTT